MSATDNKYDRQLRLWGKDGQLRLAQASVCVLGAGPAATETLKNLVLPGLGSFTVVDGARVSVADLGNNFFVAAADLGRPRAEVVRDLLVEMNPDDCKGEAVAADPAAYLASHPAFLHGFTLVVAAQLDPLAMLAVAAQCWERRIPLMVLNTCGYLGSIRLQLRDHEVIESKPDTKLYDFRLAAPWPGLADHAATYALDAMPDKDHSHTPYVVLLLHAVGAWRASQGGGLPTTFAEKQAFKARVAALQRPTAKEKELNVAEAVSNAYRAYAPLEPSEDLVALLERCRASPPPPADATDFAFLAHALAGFVDCEGGGLPPVTGTIPDMEADNPKYIALQRCYEAKAAADCAAVHARVAALLTACGRAADAAAGTGPADPELCRRFCKSAWDLKVVTTRSVAAEHAKPNVDPDCVFEMSQEELWAQSPALWYLALRGAEAFRSAHGRAAGADPTADAASLAADTAAVWAHVQAVLASAECGPFPQLTEDYAAEVVRFGCAPELHNVAALIGGTAAQEAAKVITHQWVPVNNTFVYNGVAGTAQSYEF